MTTKIRTSNISRSISRSITRRSLSSGIVGDRVAVFDGSSDYVDFGDDTDFEMGTNAFSIVARINLTNIAGDMRTIFSKHNTTGNKREYWFRVTQTTGILTLTTSSDGSNTNTFNSTPAVSLDTLTWVGLTKNTGADDVVFYIDGLAVAGSGTAKETVLGQDANALCGARQVGAGVDDLFPGVISDLYVWNGTALSAAQQLGVTKGVIPQTNLKLSIKNTGINDSNWIDHSGNSNNGTVVGSPTTNFIQ